MKVVVIDKAQVINGFDYPDGSVVQVDDNFPMDNVRRVIKDEPAKSVPVSNSAEE